MITTLQKIAELAENFISSDLDQVEGDPAVNLALGTALGDFARSRQGSAHECQLAQRLSDLEVLHRLFTDSRVETGAQTAALQAYSNLTDRLHAVERRFIRFERRGGLRNPASWSA